MSLLHRIESAMEFVLEKRYAIELHHSSDVTFAAEAPSYDALEPGSDDRIACR